MHTTRVDKRVIMPTDAGVIEDVRERMTHAGDEAEAGVRRSDNVIDASFEALCSTSVMGIVRARARRPAATDRAYA